MAEGRYKWAVAGMMWLVCFFNYADRQAIYSVFPLLGAEMGLDNVQLGALGSSFMVVYALSAPLAGLVGDRVSRKALILGGLIFWSLVTMATALASAHAQLVFFRALLGFAQAFFIPASMSLVSDYHGPATRSRAMSIQQSSVYAGTIAGSAAAGALGQLFGWRSSFYLFGGLGVVLGLALVALLREPKRGAADGGEPPARPAWSDVPKLFGTPMVVVLIGVFTGANFVAMIFLTWMPSFLYHRFGMSLAMAGLNATAWLQIASILGVLAGGALADRWAARGAGGRMMTQAIGLFCGFPFIFLTGWTLSVPVLVLAMAGFGYFKGFYDANIWASLYDVVPVARRATAVGVMNSIGWLGGSLAPLAVAWAARDYGMGAAISANSVVYALFGCLMVWGVRRFVRRRANP